MKKETQDQLLKMIERKRYEYDPVTGGILSNVIPGKRALLTPTIKKGLKMYCLWSVDNERIMIYGHYFTWLACGYTLKESDAILFKTKDHTNTKIMNLKLRAPSVLTAEGFSKKRKINVPRVSDKIRQTIIQDYFGRATRVTVLAARYGLHRNTITNIILHYASGEDLKDRSSKESPTAAPVKGICRQRVFRPAFYKALSPQRTA